MQLTVELNHFLAGPPVPLGRADVEYTVSSLIGRKETGCSAIEVAARRSPGRDEIDKRVNSPGVVHVDGVSRRAPVLPSMDIASLTTSSHSPFAPICSLHEKRLRGYNYLDIRCFKCFVLLLKLEHCLPPRNGKGACSSTN